MINKIKENIKSGMQDVKNKALEDGGVIATTIKDNVTRNVNHAKVGAKEYAKDMTQESVNIAKQGIFSVVNGVLLKIAMFAIFIVVIAVGGCVGSNVLVDKLTDKDKVETISIDGK